MFSFKMIMTMIKTFTRMFSFKIITELRIDVKITRVIKNFSVMEATSYALYDAKTIWDR